MEANSFRNIKIIVFITCLLLCGCDSEKPREEPEIIKEISFSYDSGFYDEEISLEITSPTNSSIFYSLDGSNPTDSSNKYTEPILFKKSGEISNKISNVQGISALENLYFPNFNVDKCQILKAVEYYDDGTHSNIYTKYYFVGVDEAYYSDLPIVFLNIDYDDLFDYEKGIYVTGKTYDEAAKEGYPEEIPANYNNKGKEWERLAKFTYFDKNHSFKFSQDIGVRIHGGWSRSFNQKSFNLYARKEYSQSKTFNEPIFGESLSKSFMLRSGGYRDTFFTKSRDTLTQDFAKGLKAEFQDNFPVILFLNNEYWGIYNLQQRYTDSYFEEKYGIDKDNIIVVEKDNIDEGKNEDIAYFNEMKNFFLNSDLSDNESYEKAKSIIDIDSFVDYMAIEMIIGNVDWPYNNVKIFRSRESGENIKEDCRWRFCLYDTDDSMDMIAKCAYDSDPFENAAHWKNGPLDSNCTIGLLFSSLITNTDFKNVFAQRFTYILNNIFSDENVTNYIRKRKNLLEKPITLFYKRFVSNDSDVYNSDYFNEQMDKIPTYFKNRRDFVLDKMKEHLAIHVI